MDRIRDCLGFGFGLAMCVMMPSGYWWRHHRKNQEDWERERDDAKWADDYGWEKLKKSLEATEWVLALPFPPEADPQSWSARAANEEENVKEKYLAAQQAEDPAFAKGARKMTATLILRAREKAACPEKLSDAEVVTKSTPGPYLVAKSRRTLPPPTTSSKSASSCRAGPAIAKPAMPTGPPPVPMLKPPPAKATVVKRTSPLPADQPPWRRQAPSQPTTAGMPAKRPKLSSQPAACKGPPAVCKGRPAALAEATTTSKSSGSMPPERRIMPKTSPSVARSRVRSPSCSRSLSPSTPASSRHSCSLDWGD